MLIRPETMGDTWRPRPDGPAKVTGSLPYLTDLVFPNMLIGKVLRSAYPHAELESIDTDEAKRLPGVHAILTHEDVPRMNRFGIVMPDQPVFCEDRVRFVGDAICAVAADTAEIATQALRLVKVVYRPLPVVTNPEAALTEDAPRLHPNGNVLHRAGYRRGKAQDAMADCSVIVEETYETPRQMHAYLETEGGVVVPEEDGSITVYMGTQHGYRDRQQLARILAMPEHAIRIVSSPMGGSFGGKDELNVQPYAALLALATGRPVKIHQTRAESVRSALKRHPMQIHMRTGADANGHILAHQVSIVADTGAYATLGPAVLDFAVEHATGPYRIPNLEIEGVSVFTNNGVSGEFRGFGGNQVTFAVEGQVERLAAKLGIDPWEMRRRNLRHAEDLGPLGQRIAPTDGAAQVLEAIRRSPVWPAQTGAAGPVGVGSGADVGSGSGATGEGLPLGLPWKRRGVGMALAMHGSGLGFGRPDPAGGRLSLMPNGKVEVAFGFEEVGQGLLAVIEQLATSELGCAPEDLCIRIGDTAVVPVSGSTTASRATNVVYQAIRRMKPSWQAEMVAAAARLTGLPAERLRLGPGGVWDSERMGADRPVLSYRSLAQQRSQHLPTAEAHFSFPTTPDAVTGGHYLYTFGAVVAQVEVDLLTGSIEVRRLDQAIAAGPVIHPMGYAGQIEGGGSMALGFTLMEDVPMTEGFYEVGNFDSYLIPTIADVPRTVDVDAIEQLLPGDPFGPRGVGEIGTVAVAPAIAAAVHNACGYVAHRLPISPKEIVQSWGDGTAGIGHL
ncbi:xanthine dehydrogenase subunit D [Alicyclobacillus ferrooxydans]|uniref:Xanthine dehydrogenase n=1 Tax=Alicyclobacillus ferrooxydans TaxID=471514 RepID=A0A0P9EV64_9BACL|nr:xanthine dehydrogenase subunit D [Alicyclobacillus ferrooxydans]KPV42879.1 xanthine dehydrogenase [Alicyclobacillus ferrooxydans]